MKEKGHIHPKLNSLSYEAENEKFGLKLTFLYRKIDFQIENSTFSKVFYSFKCSFQPETRNFIINSHGWKAEGVRILNPKSARTEISVHFDARKNSRTDSESPLPQLSREDTFSWKTSDFLLENS